jgi:hypothetical protein
MISRVGQHYQPLGHSSNLLYHQWDNQEIFKSHLHDRRVDRQPMQYVLTKYEVEHEKVSTCKRRRRENRGYETDAQIADKPGPSSEEMFNC